jgi:hypothetical protein
MAKVSDFMLERYRHGELSPEDMEALETAVSGDAAIRLRLEKLDESDRELRLQYPVENFNFIPIDSAAGHSKRAPVFTYARGKAGPHRKAGMAGIAAAVLAGILIPLLYFVLAKDVSQKSRAGIQIASGTGGDRPKGFDLNGPELSVYLKSDAEIQLPDQTVLGEGNTVQLAYTAPAGTEHYGVIFSIDGRSFVTAHYPYGKGQSSLLVSGKRTFLDEAYTLDDAPDYEVFIFVVSGEPLDAEAVLNKARDLAGNIKEEDIQSITEKSIAVFEGCEVDTVTVLKKKL